MIFQGGVPEAEYKRMANPLMLGQLPYPVAYGYCNVGEVLEGPSGWIGQQVFSLAPHQTLFDAPVSMLSVIPQGLPLMRATLAANMETALNAVWTGKPGPGDRIAVVGAGIVGLLIAYLCRNLPGCQLLVIDPAQHRATVCESLGLRWTSRAPQASDFDVIFHASGQPGGLKTALTLAGNEAMIVEVSWYGKREVGLDLGGAFHSRQLRLQSCQVGHIESTHAPRWTHHRRLATALELLHDNQLDCLLEPAIDFDSLPTKLPQLLSGQSVSLCQVIAYD